MKEYENKLRRSLMSRSSDQGEPTNFSKMKVINNYGCQHVLQDLALFTLMDFPKHVDTITMG